MPRSTAWEDDWDSRLASHNADDDEPTVPCPYCQREIHEESQRCPYCEQYISQEDAPRAGSPGG
jgi:hypothetical protein